VFEVLFCAPARNARQHHQHVVGERLLRGAVLRPVMRHEAPFIDHQAMAIDPRQGGIRVTASAGLHRRRLAEGYFQAQPDPAAARAAAGKLHAYGASGRPEEVARGGIPGQRRGGRFVTGASMRSGRRFGSGLPPSSDRWRHPEEQGTVPRESSWERTSGAPLDWIPGPPVRAAPELASVLQPESSRLLRGRLRPVVRARTVIDTRLRLVGADGQLNPPTEPTLR